MNLPNQIKYAHLIKPEFEPLPFELRTVPISWRIFPPDDIEDYTTYQVRSIGGAALSAAESTPEQAMAQAAYWLMDNSRTQYNKANRALATESTKEEQP